MEDSTRDSRVRYGTEDWICTFYTFHNACSNTIFLICTWSYAIACETWFFERSSPGNHLDVVQWWILCLVGKWRATRRNQWTSEIRVSMITFFTLLWLLSRIIRGNFLRCFALINFLPSPSITILATNFLNSQIKQWVPTELPMLTVQICYQESIYHQGSVYNCWYEKNTEDVAPTNLVGPVCLIVFCLKS